MSVIRKPVLYLLFIILFLFPLSFSEKRTTMNTSVDLAPNVFISTYTDKSSYCPPENISIATSIENKGNLGVNGDLATVVYDPYSNEFKRHDDFDVSLNPTEIKTFYLNHTVSESDVAGLYTSKSSYSYDGKTKNAEVNFRIKKGFGTLAASPSVIEKTVFPGDLIVENVYFWLLYPCHGASVVLNTSAGTPGEWVFFSANPIWISPETWNVTKVAIYIDLPWNTIPDNYTGYIYASIDGNLQLSIPIIIHVQTIGIFDVITEVLPQYKEICHGNDVSAKTTVIKIFPPETFDVDLTYRVQDNNTVYGEKKESVAITDKLERYNSFKMPSNVPEGIYTFYSILNASGENWTTSVVSYDTFLVKDCVSQPPTQAPGEPSGEFYPSAVVKKELLLNVSKNKLLVTVGNSTSFLALVKNLGDEEIKNVKISISGISNEWITVYPEKQDLKAGEQKDFLVIIKTLPNTKEGNYPFKIKAIDDVSSNEESVLLIVGRDEESLTKILYQEVERVRIIANLTLQMSCLEIKDVKLGYEEGEKLRELGIIEMNGKNYKKSQEFFVQALTSYENAINKADVLMDLRFSKLKPFAIFPFSIKIKAKMNALAEALGIRDYSNFCVQLGEITKYSSYSIFTFSLLLLILIIIVFLLFAAYKRRKEREFESKFERIKERLKDVTIGK